jgi:hypothetical protein
MPVRDVEVLYLFERFHERAGAGDIPNRVTNPIIGLEVVERLGLLDLRHAIVNRRLVPVGKHDGLGVRLLREDVPRPIVLLGRTGLLVLHNGPVVVFGDRGAPEDARLLPPVHDETVHVHGGSILAEGIVRLHKLAEVDGALLIDGLVVLVDLGREVNLGASHMQETSRLSLGALACFFGADDIVRNGRNLFDVLREGPHGPKWMQGGHESWEVGDRKEAIGFSIQSSV